jgi:nucleoside-diphosphate-sugar epimerase
MPKRILVTGTSGQVGAAIAAQLAPEHEVLGLDRVPGRHTTELGDVAHAALVDALMCGVDAVVHTAALHAPHVAWHPASAFQATNVQGTRVLLDAAIRHGVARFVYTSTTSLYGRALVPAGEAVWVTEELQPRPRDIYDETKLEAEACCRAMAERHGIPCVSLRIARCFPEPDERVLLYRLYRGVDVRDVAEAHRLALGAALEQPFTVCNIAAQTPFLREETAELLRNAPVVIRRRCPLVEQEFLRRGWRLPAGIERVYVIDRAREQLGFVPVYNYERWLADNPT